MTTTTATSVHVRTDFGTTEITTRTTIPLVSHIITDEDVGALSGVKIKPIDLNRAVKLLTDPHCCQLYERHVNALKRIASRYHRGFLMRDCVQVFRILNICADRISEQKCYIDAMCDIIRICGLPQLKEKLSDEITYEQIVIESMSQLGYLMRVPHAKVRLAIADALISFYKERPPNLEQVKGCKYTSQEFNKKIIEGSDVAETLVKSLGLLEEDIPVKLKILKVLLTLSCDSEINCQQMLKSEAAYQICCDMNQQESSGFLLFVSVEILWNLLEHAGDIAGPQLCNLDCINAIKEAFHTLVVSGCSDYERQLRNDLLVITTLIAQHPSAPIVETGFAKQLVLFGTFSEVKSHNPLVRKLKLTQSPEDMEFKKLLINLMIVLSKDGAAVRLMSEGKLLLSLFHYVRPNEDKSPPREWSPAQFEELQLHAMSALSTLSSLMMEDYMVCQGNTRLLLLLEWCTSQDNNFSGHGNSFHGGGGRGNKKAQMRGCLRLLRAVVSHGNESTNQDLCDQGIIGQLLSILENMSKYTSSEGIIDIEMQCDMLYVLSTLCENDLHRKELFGSQGVEMLIHYMRSNPKKVSSGLGHNRLMLTVVDAIWCCCVGCFVTEDILLEKEGVFLLIDLLETCPRTMHNLILGCLLELCENPKTIPHIHTWRGEDDISAPHLLIHMWRQEEQRINVKRDMNGCIADDSAALAGQMQLEHEVVPQPHTASSLSIVDVYENLRAKVYAVFARLGFSDLPGLTTEDYVTLAVIEKYLDFKVGEVWKEISDELRVENVRPITPDLEAMETIGRASVERSKGVALLQAELLDAENQQNSQDEKQLYAEIKENFKQKESSIQRWSDYIKRTSDHDYLVMSKKKLDKSIESSRAKPRYRDDLTTSSVKHTTHITDLNTTTFQGRNIHIDSTPAEMTKHHLMDSLLPAGS
uniref:cilia- and flagella-associated protein 69-like n=1 Tax=Styela clava TaxID=7725 RepID=UPI00193A0A1E|nr:cilia- and flagella-associated protein 69-like [Styela clava]